MQFRFTNWCLEQRVFLDRNPKRSTCVVLSIFSKKYNSMTLVWKIIEICTQNKMNQRRKNRPLVLNRETKWKIFVLNGVNVWRPRRQTSTQTFLEWPPPPPPFPQVMDLLRLDCEHSLFFFRFNGGRAHARASSGETRAAASGSSCVFSHASCHLRISRVLLDGPRKKERLLVVYT